MKDGSHIYKARREVRHAERPGFRINELEISPGRTVPWHYHNNVRDTFYLLEGQITIYLRDPEEEISLRPNETFSVEAKRPHKVVNPGDTSSTFFVLQGIGEYDYIPLE